MTNNEGVTWHDMINVPEDITNGRNATPSKVFLTTDGEELDRTKYVTSSEIGKCLRMIKYGKQVAAVPVDVGQNFLAGSTWGYAERGDIIESWAVEMLHRSSTPVRFLFLGSDQRTFLWGNRAGTPDGLAFIPGSKNYVVVIDFKSIDPRVNRSKLPREYEYAQVQNNIDLVREYARQTGKSWSVVGAVLVYIDASNVQDMIQLSYDVDEEYIAELRNRANLVMRAERGEDLPPEGLFTADGCKYCPFTDKCPGMAEQKQASEEALAAAERAISSVFRR